VSRWLAVGRDSTRLRAARAGVTTDWIRSGDVSMAARNSFMGPLEPSKVVGVAAGATSKMRSTLA